MNMEEQLRAVVNEATTDAGLWHNIVHGTDTQTIGTENGEVPSVAKQLKDIRNAIMGGVVDVISVAELARDDAIAAKTQTETIKSQTQVICDTAEGFRDEAETFKNLSQTTFNNIVTTTNTAITNIQNETAAQITNVQAAGAGQIEKARVWAEGTEAEVSGQGGIRSAKGWAELNLAITTLPTSGTINLSDNSIYRITPTSTVSFVLPAVADDTIFHQILVQMTLTANRTINLGANYYIGGNAPSFGVGNYSIFYEYDGTRWNVGAVFRGVL